MSNLGRIKTLSFIDRRGWKRKEKILNPTNAELVLTYEDGSKKHAALASLVLLAFVGPPPKGCYLSRHLNDDRADNRVENLAWGTDADNRADAIRNDINFISYGHLGHKHSEETKKLLRRQRLGKPTGRKMTPQHKEAIVAGYRKRFPIKQAPVPQACGCGCGELAKAGKLYIHGHHARALFKKIAAERTMKPRKW